MIFNRIPTSFEGKYGSIRYWIKGEVEKPWSFNHKTKKAFTVMNKVDINRECYMVKINFFLITIKNLFIQFLLVNKIIIFIDLDSNARS